MAAALAQVSLINFCTLNKSHHIPSNKLFFWRLKSLQPIKCHNFSRPKGVYLCKSRFKKEVYEEEEEDRFSFLGGDGILLRGDRWKRSCKRVVLTRFKDDFGFDGLGGDGGGGGSDNGGTARVLGNLALAIGLTYLSVTGQFGWILDAIVSIWV